MGWAVIISRRPAPLALLLIPWAHQAQSNPTAPSDLAAAIVGGRIALEWEDPTQHAASIPGTPQLGETPAADIPNVVDAHGLNHAAFTCHRAVGAAAHAGIQDATDTARSLSAEVEDDGRPSKAPTPFTDHRHGQEALARPTVAFLLGPRRAPPDPQVEAGARNQSHLAVARSWRPNGGTAAPPSNPGRSAEVAWQRIAPASRSGHCQWARKRPAEPDTSIHTGAGGAACLKQSRISLPAQAAPARFRSAAHCALDPRLLLAAGARAASTTDSC